MIRTRLMSIGSRVRSREEQLERGAALAGGIDPYDPAHVLHRARDDREPQPRAAPGLLGREERVEDAILVLGGNTGPGIGDEQQYPRLARSDLRAHRSPLEEPCEQHLRGIVAAARRLPVA